MISRFEAFNKNVADKEDMENNKFVASLDIKSLFPSSAIKLEGLNHKELGIFLRKNTKSEEIRDKNITHLVPNKMKKPKKYTKHKDNN